MDIRFSLIYVVNWNKFFRISISMGTEAWKLALGSWSLEVGSWSLEVGACKLELGS